MREIASATGLLLLLFLAVVPPATAQDAAQDAAARVVMRVNGTAITVERFNTTYVQHLIQTGRNDTPEQRYTHLDNLVDDILLADDAQRRSLEDADYRAYVDRQIKKAVGGRYYGVAFLDSLPDLTELEVRHAFRNGKDKVVVRHLLYRSPEEAAAAHARLEAGADFLALANACFDTPAFDSLAGFLGVAGYWELDDAFAEVAFALPVGAYSKPVRTRYGWHVIRVEDRIVEPIITESEYQYRRKGVVGKARQRRMRLEGDRFVRSFMEGLGVVADRSGVAALQAAVRRAMGAEEAGGVPRTALDEGEVRAIRDELTPETVLASYVVDGEERVFTARDYVAWLEELPYGELRNRPAASVGRALRNEVLAQHGLALGLDRDEWVQEEVQFRSIFYLADRLRTHLRTDERAAPTEAELREGFERLGYRKLETAKADYWQVRFASFPEAEAALRAIQAGGGAEAYPSYAHRPGADLRAPDELGAHVRRAPLHTPVVIGTGDGAWYVVRVDDRTLTYTTFEQARPRLETVLSTYLPEFRLLQDLRGRAEIDFDRDLFERIMKLDGTV